MFPATAEIFISKCIDGGDKSLSYYYTIVLFKIRIEKYRILGILLECTYLKYRNTIGVRVEQWFYY